MLRTYPGSANAYIYGPVCVAESHRGRELARAMFVDLRARLRAAKASPSFGGDNTASIAAHTRMGMREAAQFMHGGIAYVVVAYQG